MKTTTDGRYDGFSIAQLKVKRRVAAQMIIKPLRTTWKDDPRAKKAFVHYQAEYAIINQALIRKIRERREAAGQPEPARQEIGMANLQLFGKAQKQ